MDDETYTLLIHRIDNYGNDHIFRADSNRRYLAESCYEMNLALFEMDMCVISWVMVLYMHVGEETMVIRSDESRNGKGLVNLSDYVSGKNVETPEEELR